MIILSRQIVASMLLILIVPYILLLTFGDGVTGKFLCEDRMKGDEIALDVSLKGQNISKEAYLQRLVAVMIPAEYEKETIKAQMIITRTWLNKRIEKYQNLDRTFLISEKELGIPMVKSDTLKELWGNDYPKYSRKFEEASEETKGMVISYEGEKIDALYHRASTGRTRPGDEYHPYLTSVESMGDKQIEDYLKVYYCSKENFLFTLNKKADSKEMEHKFTQEDLSTPIEVLSRDLAGYIISIKICNHIFTGDEIQKKFGLSSACFEIDETEGQMRIKTEGIGHGYGFSQYGANELAKCGKSAEALLNHYYKNITLNVE